MRVYKNGMRKRWAGVAAVARAAIVAAGAWFAGASKVSDADFIEHHWHQPLAPQGPAPAGFWPIERSLAPQSCGMCHPVQLADWKTSRHAHSMGPGVAGQLAGMWRSDPDSARLCLTCHAPLAEQAPGTPGFDATLQQHGVVCAACHVRGHRRFGPPRREDAAPTAMSPGTMSHGGATRMAAFTVSQFCSVCHQFARDGHALNGKPLENTYAEWTASPAAARGRQCQDCHMPDRRHLWRGIHDRDMVASGVRVSLNADRSRYRAGDELTATLIVASPGVGHSFPTYVTPRVVVRLWLADASGREIGGSAQEHTIGREIALDLSREIADTRIPPGGESRFEYRQRVDSRARRLVAMVTVEPDAFYTRFFASLLAGDAGAGADALRAALAESRRSAFQIFNESLPLN